ncbi:MAG TPA: N-acetylmuramoyl-L-alanine amidase [Solirubrobacterales bacterium]
MSEGGRRAKLAIAVAVFALLAVATLTVLRGPDAAGASGIDPIVLGHSVEGRAITAVRVGDPYSPRKALVVGVIRGDEPAGGAVTRQILRRYRGVDLNRNFSYRWRDGVPTSSGYYPGPHPFSEPESRAVRKLVRQLQPQVSIWFHQLWDQVLAPCHGDASLQRGFSQLSGIPLKRCRGEDLRGTAIDWQQHTFPGTHAFVVELVGGSISAAAAKRDARAVVKVTRDGAATASSAGVAGRAAASSVPRPAITRKLIPFPPHRRREMAAYSKRHYGKAKWRLTNPHVIVEHISVTDGISALYNTFAPDHPDPELHELPNVCSHFGVGSNGRIYQFVRLDTRCRHTVGLNYTAIGIEHVGFKDADVLGNARQLHASLRLTQYLRCRFGIKIRNVIGHNESLSSPYHLELVPSLKHQTHGDWKHASMQIYRRKLRQLGPC